MSAAWFLPVAYADSHAKDAAIVRDDTPRWNELTAGLLAAAVTAVTLVLIYVGSRGLRDFDAALVGYAVGTIFAIAGLTYRYTLWLTRPPTWRYFKAGWNHFLSWRNFRRYTTLVPVALWTDIFGQTFILRRSPLRWVMHMCIFWGVLLSLAITIPLTFGWFRFTLSGEDQYRMWFFGFKLFRFPLDTLFSFVVFHALNFTAIILLVGVAIALWRRLHNVGLLITQEFAFDLFPLALLFTIAITGLALTSSSLFWEGDYYWFISLVHQLVVVLWLLYLPFGKFFHIIERPATIGITLYQTVSHDRERDGGAVQSPQAACRRCGEPMPSAQFVSDIELTLGDLGQRYDLGEDRGLLQHYCPTCKRVLRGQAYYELMGSRFV